ncbi:MAG: SMP-30/gluconolactonase/LRE family protein [Planctomycetales bacterium]|nr:SMP-30/gluconolactonase/LRE family protein [Planctomycetales bacterium]
MTASTITASTLNGFFIYLGLAAVLAALNVDGARAGDKSYETMGELVRLDPRFDELVSPTAKIEKLASGFAWSEGPVWIADGGYMLFSDIPNNRVMCWCQADGLSEFLKPAGYTGEKGRGGEPGSNGLLVDSEGRLVLCEHGDRRIGRINKDGEHVTLADRYNGKRFNSPNDGVFHSSGALYFTDPPYGLEGGVDDPAKELTFQGVYRLDPDGTVTLLTDEMSRPNGIAFSPDEKTLYVANSDGERAVWMAFDVEDDGSIANGRVFYDATEQMGKLPGAPDGLKVDVNGNLFATGPGGVYVFTPKGELLGRISTGERTANCGWGEDGTVLYMTADSHFCRIKTNTKGKGF